MQFKKIYNPGTPGYYILQIMLVLYGIGYLCSLTLIQNATIKHTYNEPNNNGVLMSDRYNSLHWLAMFFATMRVFILLVVCSLLLYRKVVCCAGKYPVCTIFWTLILFCLVMADLLGFAILGSFSAKANGHAQHGNPANDPLLCCVPEIFNDPVNVCGSTIGCPTGLTLSDMKTNEDFKWLMSLTVVFVAFDLIFLMLPFSMWIYDMPGGGVATADSTQEQEQEEKVYDDEDEDEDDDDLPPAKKPLEAMRRMQSRASSGGGSRKRVPATMLLKKK